MTLTRNAVVDQIEITRNGTLQVRITKQIVDGDRVVTSEFHRTSVPPGGDVDGQMRAVNAHLNEMGWPAIDVVDIEYVKKHAAVAWTPEVIAAFLAQRAKADAAAAAPAQ